MGNLVRDFFTYEYKGKSYYGIIEVIKGEDVGQNRHEKKYEQHIEKALQYTMDNKVLSHMSIQTYCKWLNGKVIREENEQKYYPFVMEFESKDNYSDMVMEAAVYVQHLINNYDIAEEDILIMINNSKSVYVSVNPKAYGLKPSKVLHRVYTNMYQEIKEELGFKYVDSSIVTSSYKLMKTPNTYYNGGYFVRISLDELTKLMAGSLTKQELTRHRRDLNTYVPGRISFKFAKLYSAALKKAINKVNKPNNTEKKCTEDTPAGQCVMYLMQNLVEEGYRNFALVSAGIYLKNIGYSAEEVTENLQELAASWNHDENGHKIQSKVKSIFRRNYKFSCSYAREAFADLGIENLCSKCPYSQGCCSKKSEGINVDPEVINELWSKKASTRHYVLYLELLEKGLFNKELTLDEFNINDRTLRELIKLDNKHFSKEKKDNQVVIIRYIHSNRSYGLPRAFVKDSIQQLGDSLKHYLKMLTKGYKSVEEFLLIRISKDTLAKELGYSDVSALYKFLKKLKDLGYVKEHKNNVYALYYETYKVISIESNKEIISPAAAEGRYLTAVGEQIMIPEYEKNLDEFRFIWHTENENDPGGRGSPG